MSQIYKIQLDTILKDKLENPDVLNKSDEQVYLKDLVKMVMVLATHPKSQELTHMI